VSQHTVYTISKIADGSYENCNEPLDAYQVDFLNDDPDIDGPYGSFGGYINEGTYSSDELFQFKINCGSQNPNYDMFSSQERVKINPLIIISTMGDIYEIDEYSLVYDTQNNNYTLVYNPVKLVEGTYDVYYKNSSTIASFTSRCQLNISDDLVPDYDKIYEYSFRNHQGGSVLADYIISYSDENYVFAKILEGQSILDENTLLFLNYNTTNLPDTGRFFQGYLTFNNISPDANDFSLYKSYHQPFYSYEDTILGNSDAQTFVENISLKSKISSYNENDNLTQFNWITGNEINRIGMTKLAIKGNGTIQVNEGEATISTNPNVIVTEYSLLTIYYKIPQN
jgi:hypothetical protein